MVVFWRFFCNLKPQHSIDGSKWNARDDLQQGLGVCCKIVERLVLVNFALWLLFLVPDGGESPIFAGWTRKINWQIIYM